MITLLLHNTTHNNNSNNKKTCTPSEDMPLQVALFVSTTLQYGTSLVSLQDKHFQELPRFGNHGSSLCIALFSSNNCFKQKTKKKKARDKTDSAASSGGQTKANIHSCTSLSLRFKQQCRVLRLHFLFTCAGILMLLLYKLPLIR